MIRLELPNSRFKDSYIGAVKEFLGIGIENDSTKHYFKRDLSELETSFDSLVEETLAKRDRTEKDERVPSTEFWIIDDDNIYCGKVSLRHKLNEELLKKIGNIGYDIRPSMRGKSYAKQALSLCLKEAKKMGIDKVLLTVDDNNIASIKVIENNGGVLEDKTPQDSGILLRRYWISLD